MTEPIRQQRISIAYLIENFGHGGGTENYLHTVASQLDLSRFDPIIIALGPRWHDFDVSAPCEIVHLGSSHLLHWRFIGPFFRLVGILRRRRVQILQTFYPNARLVGMLAALLARVPCVVVSRRDCHAKLPAFQRAILLVTSQFADFCLANSEAARHVVLRQERFKPERVTVIANSIVAINRGLLDGAAAPEPAELVVGMVANLRPVKRIDVFLRLARRLAAEADRFEIVGYGREDERRRYAALADELGITSRLTMSHTNTEVTTHLRTFAICVLTSESEGLSNALIEYAVGGRPAVAFDVGGNREVIRHGVTGFLAPPGREDLLCAYVRQLIHDPELRHRMGVQARAHALKAFAIDRMVRETEAFYERALRT